MTQSSVVLLPITTHPFEYGKKYDLCLLCTVNAIASYHRFIAPIGAFYGHKVVRIFDHIDFHHVARFL